jgi:hypothetical protein
MFPYLLDEHLECRFMPVNPVEQRSEFTLSHDQRHIRPLKRSCLLRPEHFPNESGCAALPTIEPVVSHYGIGGAREIEQNPLQLLKLDLYLRSCLIG